jgi:uncharacterized membrane protein
VSLKASFLGSKVTLKKIRNLRKKCLILRIGVKMHYLQSVMLFNDFVLLKTKIFQIHQIKKKTISSQNKKKIRILWYWMINQIAKFQGFWWTLGPFMEKHSENDSTQIYSSGSTNLFFLNIWDNKNQRLRLPCTKYERKRNV